MFLVGAGCIGAMMLLAFFDMPRFGTSYHPYRDRAISATAAHVTPNAVSSVNFDQRAIDTLGEETIFFASVIGAAALLRMSRDEHEDRSPDEGRVLEATRLLGYLWLPLTLVVGLDVVAHGHLTPGGGFQGGVVLATGLHLLYVTGSYPALQRMRSVRAYDYVEAFGAAAFAGLGVAGLGVAGSFLYNALPLGSYGQLFSTGTVPVLNGIVAVEVGAGVMVLLAQFLEQAILLGGDRTTSRPAPRERPA
jgi:multicomponent Na+:H+ antiporter subunit B